MRLQEQLQCQNLKLTLRFCAPSVKIGKLSNKQWVTKHTTSPLPSCLPALKQSMKPKMTMKKHKLPTPELSQPGLPTRTLTVVATVGLEEDFVAEEALAEALAEVPVVFGVLEVVAGDFRAMTPTVSIASELGTPKSTATRRNGQTLINAETTTETILIPIQMAMSNVNQVSTSKRTSLNFVSAQSLPHKL